MDRCARDTGSRCWVGSMTGQPARGKPLTDDDGQGGVNGSAVMLGGVIILSVGGYSASALTLLLIEPVSGAAVAMAFVLGAIAAAVVMLLLKLCLRRKQIAAKPSVGQLQGFPHRASVVWRQYEGSSAAHQSGRILCVGSADPMKRMTHLARRLVWTRSSVDLIDDFEAALEIIVSSPDKWKLLIVDVDYVERALDIEDVVHDLIAFREECSSCAIALLSFGFASDDGSLIRSTIADYSFRATVSDERIIAALPDVYENHEEFLKRVSSRFRNDSIPPIRGLRSV